MSFGLTILTISYIVFLIVPGLFFRKFYFRSKFNTDFSKGAFADRLVTSIFWGLIIQIISVFILSFAIDYSFDLISVRVTNLYGSLHENKIPNVSAKQLNYILIFLLISLGTSCLMGTFLHNFIRAFKLDVKFSPLRFSNEWNYIFRNELDNSKFTFDEFVGTYLSTEVDIYMNEFKEDRPSFYTGILKDYHLTPEGNLDRISLKRAKKRVLKSEDPLKLIDIKGDTFIIPYCNIANMNLRYNYTYRDKRKKIPKYLKNTIYIILVSALLPVLIFPWFTDVSIWFRMLGIVLLILSWAIITGGTSNFFNEEKKARTRDYIYQIFISAILLFLALYVLGVFDIIEYIKYISESIYTPTQI